MDKEIKEKILGLIKEERYDDVFREYGIKAYKKYVPAKYRKQDLKKLKKEGRYEDIFNKYGEKEFKKVLVQAKQREIKEAKGSFKAVSWRISREIKALFGASLLAFSLGLPTVTTAAAISTEKEIKDNAIKYEEQIKEYDNKISGYAKEINTMGLSDIQVFMKVMDDMWKGIKGYANPEKDISGFLELDLADEDGYGVCRNMASDVAKKLNKINPEYNARIMPVFMGEDGIYRVADIERNIVETNSTVQDNEEEIVNTESDKSQKTMEAVQKAIGNHMITLVDVQEDNLTLVLDPTNPGIGIYENGKVIMLNGDNVKYNSKEWVGATIIRGGINGILQTASDYVKSFEKSDISFEEIVAKYGVEAQNEALEYVRTMETIREAAYGEEKNDFFRESLKVELPKTNIVENINNENTQEKSGIELDR